MKSNLTDRKKPVLRPGIRPHGRLAGIVSIAAAAAVLAALGVLVLDGTTEQTFPVVRELRIAICAAGTAGLAWLMFLWWRARRRLGVLAPIGEALLEVNDGQTAAGSLAVGAALGEEARAWNAILGELDDVRRQLLLERARKTLGSRGTAAGDMSAACDAMSQGLILLDERSRVRYANGAARAFFPGDGRETVGADIAELISDPRALETVRSALDGPARRRGTVEIEGADGAGGVLRLSARPIRGEGTTAAILVAEDVTQQRVAAEARNAFLAKATHELRTPLMNILLYVETAMEDGEDNPAQRAQALNVINQEARRLENMVGDILSVSEIEAGSFTLQEDDVRLDALFDELRDDYEGQADEKEIDLVFNLPPKLEVIQGDRDKIAVALHNLIGNALKYTPAGGKVEVNVNPEPTRLVVEVVDTGIGISEEDAEHVFDKFYRAQDSRVNDVAGSGLGLPLAREMARLHGGDITVESELNGGSTFRLTLPLEAEVVAT